MGSTSSMVLKSLLVVTSHGPKCHGESKNTVLMEKILQRWDRKTYSNYIDIWKTIQGTLKNLQTGSKPRTKKRQFFTVLKYSSSVPVRTLKQCFDKHADSLRKIFSSYTQVNLAFSVQKNLSRLHYRDNWK